MIHHRLVTVLLLAALALAGCNPRALRESFSLPSPSERLLSRGIGQYESGAYDEAMQSLQRALDEGLDRDSDKARARKYLAFIHCISGREARCREEFRKALEVYPRLELDPAEAGHPIWGPVFRSVKGRR